MARKIQPKYIVSIILWVITLLSLFAIVAVAACKGEISDNDLYVNLITGLCVGFSCLLFGSILHIVFVKKLERKK